MKIRRGQESFIRGVQTKRIAGLLARRQYGKTTIAARIALLKMMKTPGHTVIFGSVKVDLGREIVRKESEAVQKAIASMMEPSQAEEKLLDVVDATQGRSVLALKPDDFAEVYEAQRLEFRLYHSRSVYSRTKVVALTPAAVGETGDLICDEIGRVRNWRECWEAVKPIISSNPFFRCMLTTTPPPDDGHYSFELLAPPIGMEFNPNPEGNWYKSDLGVNVLRIDAYDAYADGIPLYDDETGKPISPDEARAKEHDKEAFDRNYLVRFILGGTSAVGLLQLDAAQQRGIKECACIVVHASEDFERGLKFLQEKLGPGKVGIGVDLATTEKATSNPTSVTVMEDRGVEKIARLTLVWKTADPAVAKDRFKRLVKTINTRMLPDRTRPGRARMMKVDATNERYFATEIQRELRAEVPVDLVIQSETIERPGKDPINRKAFLGAQLVGALDDNQLTLPPERYIKTDFRLVKRDRGTFVAELGPNGEHGDTFDSHKLALDALVSSAPLQLTVVKVKGRERLKRTKGVWG